MTARKYDPKNACDRVKLAEAIRSVLVYAEFRCVSRGNGEEVWARDIPSAGGRPKTVKVFTSIYGGTCRSEGRDAIRVCATGVHVDGTHKGIVKLPRVHRSGTIRSIQDRVLSRMRKAWDEARKRDWMLGQERAS